MSHRRIWTFAALAALLQMRALGQTIPAAQNAASVPATQPEVTTITVRAYRFTGNTVFSSAELSALLVDYIGKDMTFERIDDARRKITEHYVAKGYITSGAILPEQSITDGVVWIDVIEGRLEKLDIAGNSGLSASYFTDRLGPALKTPLRIDAIKDAMEMLQQDPRIASAQGQLLPGAQPGFAVFDLAVRESRPYQFGVQFDNAGTPSTGAERVALFASHLNLTGVGDSLLLRWGPMSGGVSNPELTPSNDIFADYSRPIIGESTRLDLLFARNDLSLVEPPLSVLGSQTATDSAAVSLEQTLWHTPRNQIDLTLSLSRRDNLTQLLGHNFSFSPGAMDGWMTATALRTSLDWTTRNDTYVISARSTLSIGLDALGATIHHDAQPDSRFISWLGEAQQAWRIAPLDCTILSKASLQLTDRPLLALEQFSLGGAETVRGYPESTLLSDDAALFSLEFRKPFPALLQGVSVQGALFSDFGYGWDRSGYPGSTAGMAMASVGCGLLMDVTSHVHGELYFGVPLCNRPGGENLQDMGIYFKFLLKAF